MKQWLPVLPLPHSYTKQMPAHVAAASREPRPRAQHPRATWVYLVHRWTPGGTEARTESPCRRPRIAAPPQSKLGDGLEVADGGDAQLVWEVILGHRRGVDADEASPEGAGEG